jgi:hypothetical protein
MIDHQLPGTMGYITNRRTFLASGAALSVHRNSSAQVPQRAASSQTHGDFEVAHPGENNIREEDHYGIINGHITVGVNYKDVGGIGGMYAPPYASTDFLLEMRIGGRPVPTAEYSWTPIEVRRKGRAGDIEVASETLLLHGQRSGMLRLTITNRGGRTTNVPLQFNIVGSFDRVGLWGFPRPQTQKNQTTATTESNRVVRFNSAGAFVIASDVQDLRWEPWSSHWETRFAVQPNANRVIHLAFAMGSREDAVKMAEVALADSSNAARAAHEGLQKEWRDLYTRLPEFLAADERLAAYYKRSAMHLILNRWRVPEFVLHPYYGTGSIKGGCVGCYLWDYGLVPQLWPLFDPNANREHIKQFLRVDIGRHFLFNPMDGEGSGPWYPVNQEKIIKLIYHHVLMTGETSFLAERVGGKTVLEWAVHHAALLDVPGPVQLADYGENKSHLELRRQYGYSHLVPDLNGQRCNNFHMAATLSEMAGVPRPDLRERAKALRELLRAKLWDRKKQWFAFADNSGKQEFRYTNILYLLVGTDALERECEEGLMSHLNEREFLSEYGIHSIAKHDPAYDQVDIDHGGGGSYVAFPPSIAQQLYRAGYAAQAEDILRRTLWWGQRLPFWGDSFVANQIEYRKDTPLQCAVDAAAGAQCILFGMFGIQVNPKGHVTVNPAPPSYSPSIELRGVRLRGLTFDVRADRGGFEVRTSARTLRSKTGTAVQLTPG